MLTKKGCKWSKNQFVSPFYVEKQTITYEDKKLSSAVFSTKKGLLSTHQSAIREAPTVFSRLPSLMAADKPCPQLQPSLDHRDLEHRDLDQRDLDHQLVDHIQRTRRESIASIFTISKNELKRVPSLVNLEAHKVLMLIDLWYLCVYFPIFLCYE